MNTILLSINLIIIMEIIIFNNLFPYFERNTSSISFKNTSNVVFFNFNYIKNKIITNIKSDR